jgi:glycogen operon protein
MVEKIAEDPILAHTKIIAEAWDAAGLYQVGSFSTNRRWAEWNGQFRDDVRRFLCGHEGMVPPLATRIAGSADLYQDDGRTPRNSINFITSHDGFTLYDQVSYNTKHNLANGEDDRDGNNDNMSWNSGTEGATDNATIAGLRLRRIKTFAAILMLSQGVPMLVAGDEFGRTQQGNNNAYCQDNEISWLNWELAKKNHGLLRFFTQLIGLRKNHPVFHRTDFFPAEGKPEIEWQSTTPGRPDWSPSCKTLAFVLHGTIAGVRRDDDFFVMLNGGHTPAAFIIPAPPAGRLWHRLIDTGAASPRDIVSEAKGQPERAASMTVEPLAAAAFISKPA